MTRPCRLLASWIATLLVAVAPAAALAESRSPVDQVFQWSASGTNTWPDGSTNQGTVHLWIPEGCGRVRGLLVLGYNVPEHLLVGHPELRATCEEKFTENTVGTTQSISFDAIPDVPAGTLRVPLRATSSAGLPVEFYVATGPAVIRDGALELTALPPRAKLPLVVTVTAWQWGRKSEPRVRTAPLVSRTFRIVEPFAHWASQRLGGTALASLAGPGDDPDRDGLPNLAEFAFGLEPGLRQTASPVSINSTPDGLRIVFPRRAEPRLRYAVEEATDPASGTWSTLWSSTGDALEAAIELTGIPPTASTRFFRVRVTLP